MATTEYPRLQADRRRFYRHHEAFGQGRQGGTLLWDIGEYTIDLPSGYIPDLDTDEEEEAENRRRFKKKREDSEKSILKVDFRFCVADDSDGREEEDKFRKALHRHIGFVSPEEWIAIRGTRAEKMVISMEGA
ncbi:hypothetical protein LQV05_002468 [Cryptococcus neoformans]|nr:hypothetical protein LQV05_002468 [Cryptococcus neoformans]